MSLLFAPGERPNSQAVAAFAQDHPGFMVASLDHVMWFHRPCRADDWLLYHTHSPSAAAGRGFATGQVFCADGTLAVSVAQEGLVRPVRPVRRP